MNRFTRTILAVFVAAFPCILQSCTVAHGNSQTGVWTLASLGGDLQNVSASSEGLAAERIENSKSLQMVTDAAKSINSWQQLGKIGVSAVQGATKVFKSHEVTSRVGIVESNLTRRQQITSAVEQARLVQAP